MISFLSPADLLSRRLYGVVDNVGDDDDVDDDVVDLLDSRLYRVVEVVDWSLLGLHKAMPLLQGPHFTL